MGAQSERMEQQARCRSGRRGEGREGGGEGRGGGGEEGEGRGGGERTGEGERWGRIKRSERGVRKDGMGVDE